MNKKITKKSVKIKDEIKQIPLSITNCTFLGAQYDSTCTDAIKIIAEGLVENAKALGSLAGILNNSSVNIDAMIKVGDTNDSTL